MGGLQESFALSVPAEKAGPIVAKFHTTCTECPAFAALGEWDLTGPTDAKGGFRTITMPGAQTHARLFRGAPLAGSRRCACCGRADGGPTLTEMCTNVKPWGYSYAIVEGGEAFGISHCALRSSLARCLPRAHRPRVGLCADRATFQVVPATDTTSTLVWVRPCFPSPPPPPRPPPRHGVPRPTLIQPLDAEQQLPERGFGGG